MPKQSDERSCGFWNSLQVFGHAPLVIEAHILSSLFLSSFAVQPSFSFHFFLMVGNEGEPTYSALEFQGCDFHCEVLKVTVHSWTCIFKHLAELQTRSPRHMFQSFKLYSRMNRCLKVSLLLNTVCVCICADLSVFLSRLKGHSGSERSFFFLFTQTWAVMDTSSLVCGGEIQSCNCASLRQKHQWINPAISVGHSGRFCYLSKSRAGPQAKARQRPGT